MAPGEDAADARVLVDHLFRSRAGQMVAWLTRLFGPAHIDLAEEVVQDALVKALQQWPHQGVPANPSAWLIQVAKNRALDLLRREATLAAKAEDIARFFSPARIDPEDEMDDQLAMMFLCSHPLLSRESRVALTLKTVAGFGAAEIARAFLIRESTAAQRIVRAKRLIRDQEFAAELRPLEPVLDTLYLMFNEGYASGGEQLIRCDLCEESIRLARLMADHHSTAAPECDALLALFLLQSARFLSRVDAEGDLLLLCDQDRALWDRDRISEGLHRLDRSARGDRMTAFHLEAGIAAAHAVAPDYASTDWGQIVHLYGMLYDLNPSPVIALNRAVAVGRWKGAEEGLRRLQEIENHAALEHYHLLPATQGRLWMELGDYGRAAAFFEKALDCECSAPERRFLEQQLRLAKQKAG
jgi:RNA polymerase sigma-70 factor (ECF subfamily)